MKTSCFRVFFSKLSEQKWLDSLGVKGYLLESANDSRYKFTVSEEHVYSYSIEHIGVAPESDTAKEYYEKLSESGIKPVLSSGQWVYFVKEDGQTEHTAEKYRKNAKPYLARGLYYLGFALTFAIVCGYQFYAINLLQSAGSASAGDVIDKVGLLESAGFFDKIINVLIAVLNFFIKIANGYFKLWQGWLGTGGASAVLSVLLPVTAVLTVMFGMNIAEFTAYRKEAKSISGTDAKTEELQENAGEENEVSETETEEEDAEQGIQDQA